jgi:HAD superfamily hydrolase (TIGR01509 family)
VTLALGGVLFDMDGTLLDSEKVWEHALHDLAAELGGELSPAARAKMVGSSMGASMAVLHDDLGVDADPEASAAYLTERMVELFATDLEWKPGAHELLLAVRAAGIPSALVTATHRRLTEIALTFMGRELFAASVCGDEVGRSKPAPEPYLRAAGLIGVTPEQCVAIEDSATGLASAHAAGCAVLAVPSEIAVPASGNWTIRDSLVGVGVPDLARLLS